MFTQYAAPFSARGASTAAPAPAPEPAPTPAPKTPAAVAPTPNSIAKARERAAEREVAPVAAELVQAIECALPFDAETRTIRLSDLKKLLTADFGGDTLSFRGAETAARQLLPSSRSEPSSPVQAEASAEASLASGDERVDIDAVARFWALSLYRDRRSRFGATVSLAEALHAGDVEAAKAALVAGADPNGSAVRSAPAWALATTLSEARGDFSLTQLVADGGGGGVSAATETELLRLLLDVGADATRSFGFGETVAHLYAKAGRAALLAPLQAAGADLDALDESELGETPLYAAARLGLVDVVAELIRLKADVDKPTAKMSQRPIWRAARGGQATAMRALLAAGASVNQRTDAGDTALHAAARAGSTECVLALLEGGADQWLTSYRGQTALAIAEEAAAAVAWAELYADQNPSGDFEACVALLKVRAGRPPSTTL